VEQQFELKQLHRQNTV